MMRKLFTLVLLAIFTMSFAPNIEKQKVVVIPIKKEINSTTWNYVKNGFAMADSLGADVIIIHMNTYGGQVVFADSIRTKILNSLIPVHVFIDNNAASAGALISLACDSIYMRSGATIGATTVVNQTGEAAPDKYQSYMRATMRATAEAQGKDTSIVKGDTIVSWRRDPKIAEAMVDQSLYVENVSDTGKLLTFTVNEAIEHGYCEGMANSIAEVVAKLGITDFDLEHYKPTAYDDVKGFLVNPVLQGLLIMLILGGIYFELQSPGIGFPLITAIAAAVLYFAPLYIDGLAANWEIALFLVGVILLILEIFVIPGFGVAGILGGLFAFSGLFLSMINNINFNFKEVETEPLLIAFTTTSLAFFIGIILSLWITNRFWGRGAFHKLSLESVQNSDEGYVAVDVNKELIGKEGEAATDLRPAGKVMVDGEIYDAMALVGMIDKGAKVKVTKQESAQLYVIQNA